MIPTRRQAATGLLAGMGLVALPRSAWSQPAPAQADPDPEAVEPATELATSRSRYEHVTVPVGVNGAGPFNFLIDTGANVSCVSQALAQRLALQPGPSVDVHTVVGVRARPSVLLDRLEVGARKRRDVHAPSLPIAGVEADGVLGVDWLKGQRLVLGFKSKTMEITRSRSDSGVEGRVVVPAKRRMGQLTIIDADASGAKISALVDSGSQFTLCNGPMRDQILAAEVRTHLPEKHAEIGMETLAGEPFVGRQMHLPFLRLGGLQLGNVPVIYADVQVFELWGLTKVPAIVLGLDLLTQFDTVAMDYGRSSVSFDVT